MASIEFLRPKGNQPNQLKYINDSGVGVNRTEGGSSRSANNDGSDLVLAPKIRYISVDKIVSLDFLTTASVPAGGFVDSSEGHIEIKYGDRYLYLRSQSFELFMKIKSFVYGGDNTETVDTVELS